MGLDALLCYLAIVMLLFHIFGKISVVLYVRVFFSWNLVKNGFPYVPSLKWWIA